MRSGPTLPTGFLGFHVHSGSHQSISYIVLISGEHGGHRKPSLYIQFSRNAGTQAGPPKACGHTTGRRLNPGRWLESARKAGRASAGPLPPAEPPLHGPPYSQEDSQLRQGARMSLTFPHQSWVKSCQCRETQAASQILSLGPRASTPYILSLPRVWVFENAARWTGQQWVALWRK